jgi:hypothetical protein
VHGGGSHDLEKEENKTLRNIAQCRSSKPSTWKMPSIGLQTRPGDVRHLQAGHAQFV